MHVHPALLDRGRRGGVTIHIVAQRLGIFGAPNFIAAGELYWGNDRLEQALAAATKSGARA